MSLSHDFSLDDELFVRYLLGQLADEDAERVDELSIADDEIAWRLRAAEDDLVDAYVRGTLDEMSRARFERIYLVTPRRRDKVRFAQSLIRSVDTAPLPVAAAAATPAKAGGARWYQWLFPTSSAGWTLAAVGALLAVVCGGLLMQAAHLRDDLSTAQTERAAADSRAQELQQRLDTQKGAALESSRELERMRGLLADAAQRTETPAPQPARPSLLTGAVALLLSPQTRSSDSMPSIALRPGADGVAFALLLESDDFPRYQVALKDPSNSQIIWRSERLAATPVNHAPAVSVVVPARLLKAQHYALELSGVHPAGGADVVGSYVVRIVQ